MLAMMVLTLPLTVFAEPTGNLQLEESKKVYSSERITFGIQSSLVNGKAHELVYQNGHKLSELIWDIRNVLMLEGSVSALLSPSWGLRLNASVSSMVTKQDSTMDDYDWLLVGADWTHWSHHENTTLEKGLTFDVNLSQQLYSDEAGAFNINAIVGFKRDKWAWKAVGGSYIYSTFFLRDTTGTFANVPVGAYEQTVNAPYAGVSLSYREEDFSVFLSIAGSPFVYAETIDQHYLRSLTITDTFASGNMVNIDFSYTYHINTAASLSLSYAYQKYYENRGDANYNYYASGVQINGPYAGMDLTYHKAGFSANYSF